MKIFICYTVVFLSTGLLHSQGCSDAGICSINKGFSAEEKTLKNRLEVAATYSLGDADLVYFSPNISYTKRFNERYTFTSTVTFTTATGSFGTRSQLGDAFLIGNYFFKEKNRKQWSALLGLKFPFTASNLKINGFSLPMDYQSSLGTIDLFLGANYRWNDWGFNAALQLPLINGNKNSYFKEFGGTNDFPSTNLFRRQPDALLRASYSVPMPTSKLGIQPNLLLIYHLGEDTFENVLGQREKIQGSEGLTVNANLITSFTISTQKRLELSLASPFVVRDVRPDGLTRSFVATLHFQYSF